jgi:hypothetical protein
MFWVLVGLQTEAVERHIRRDQIVNRQIEGHNRRQMSWLVGGAQGKIMTVLPGQTTQEEKLSRSSSIRLLQHLPGGNRRCCPRWSL